MKLQFDLGNTRAKWRYLASSGEFTRGVMPLESLTASLSELLSGLPELSELHICSVANDESVLVIVESVLKRYPDAVLYRAQSAAKLGSVVFGYQIPENQGVDRCLAMLAAFELLKANSTYSGVVVLDAGSALTVDRVDSSGAQTEGYICSGMNMMRRALLGSTARIQQGYSSGDSGTGYLSTEQCVEKGVARAFAASAASFIDEALREGLLVVVTGGDAEAVMQLYKEEGGQIIYAPDLVFDGLNLAAALNSGRH